MWNNLDDIPPEPPERSQSSKLLFKDYWTATHYSDWNDDHQDDLLIQKDQHFLGDEGVDRMEFYVNHLNEIDDNEEENKEEVEVEEVTTMYPLLDTILEETLEDLMMEQDYGCGGTNGSSSSTSSSGRWGWGWGWLNTSSDDDDSSSVIHCPNAVLPPVEVVDSSKSSGSTLTGSHDLVGAVGNLSHLSCRNNSGAEPEEEDYEEAPDSKKRRIGSSSCASPSPCPSVTESLIQFEALEKELIENPVFRTSATSAPFEDEVFLDCVEHPEEMEEEEDWICSESEEYCESTSTEEEEDSSLFCVTNRRKLHSFRSYGDGLHLLNDELDDAADLQSPLEEGSTDNKRSSTEVLSEDSGYGGVELPPNTICSPDAITADAPLLLEEENNKRRPSPLSLQEAEEFSMMNKWPEDLEEGGETRCRTSSSDVILPTAMVFSSEGSALVGIGSTDLESSKFKLEERGEGEEETVGLHSASPVEQNSLDVQRDVTCLLESSSNLEMDSAFYPAPVVLKRYGPRQEVEVYITSSSSTPQGIELIKDDQQQQHQTARGVHFSPVVSSVNWRESYLDQSDDEDEEEEEEEEDVTVEDGWQPEEEEEEEKVTIPSEQQQPHKISTELESPPLDGDSGASVVVVNSNGSDINNSNNDAGHTEQHNKKKPENLFQRFSLSRLSARMFARKKSSPPSSAELSGTMPTTDINKKKKNKNKDAVMVHPVAPPPPEILQDQQQQQQPLKKSNNKENGGGHNNNKRRFFMIRKPFQRSSSTPPETLISNKPSEPVKIEPEPIIPPPPKVELVESLPPISSDDPLPPIPAARMKKPPLPPRTIAARKNYISEMTPPTPPVPQVTSAGLEHALQHFKETARMDRERLANSVPDLLNNQPTVAPPRPTSDYIDPSSGGGGSMTTPAPKPPRHPAPPTASLSISRERARQAAQSRASSVESAWNATATKAALLSSSRRLLHQQEPSGGGFIQGHAALTRPSVPGLLETNLDAPEFRLLSTSYSKETNLDELIESLQRFRDDPSSAASSATAVTTNSDKRFKSMLNLGSSSSAPVSVQPDINNVIGTMSNGGSGNTNNNENNPDQHSRAHKSMEFLLDEENKSTVQVPENQLQKCGAERGLSEHQLRIQRSLQKLNVPEWYKSNARPSLASSSSTGSSLRRRDVHQSSTRNGGGWSGLSSTAASSMTSLSSRSGTPTRVVIPTRVPRPDWRNVKSSKESLLSSPAGVESLPPRWGSGRYSYSACPSPSPSNSSCRSIGLSQQCGRQPYLGWRSQEKLNIQQQSYLATPSERLAASTVANSIKKPSEDNMEEEIRQVTSAIVHYVDGKSRVKESHPLEALSRSPSPRRTRCVWVESSFVGEGIPPVNGHHHQEERRPPSRSPLPPVPPPRSSATQIRSTAQPAAAGSIAVNVTIESSSVTINAAPTLDDVLNSLLGLAPPPQQIRRPVSQNSITSSSNKSINNKDNNFDDIRSAGLASR